jgi:hypothetical protein
MTRADDVKARHAGDLLARPGVWSVGVERRAGSEVIVVGVDGAADRAALPTDLDGVPVELVDEGPVTPH